MREDGSREDCSKGKEIQLNESAYSKRKAMRRRRDNQDGFGGEDVGMKEWEHARCKRIKKEGRHKDYSKRGDYRQTDGKVPGVQTWKKNDTQRYEGEEEPQGLLQRG